MQTSSRPHITSIYNLYKVIWNRIFGGFAGEETSFCPRVTHRPSVPWTQHESPVQTSEPEPERAEEAKRGKEAVFFFFFLVSILETGLHLGSPLQTGVLWTREPLEPSQSWDTARITADQQKLNPAKELNILHSLISELVLYWVLLVGFMSY